MGRPVWRVLGELAVCAVAVALVVALNTGESDGEDFPYGPAVEYGSGTRQSTMLMHNGGKLGFPIDGTFPDRSVDGRVVYARGGDLYVRGSDRVESPLTTGTDRDARPVWSPEGTRVAFERGRGVAVVDDATGWVATVVVDASRPAWSPDGTRLALHSRSAPCSSAGGGCILAVHGDGSDPRVLVDDVRFPAADAPNWSPDGALLSFVYDDDPAPGRHSGGIAIVSVMDGRPRSLTRDADVDDASPDWGRAGHRLAFLRDGHPYLRNEVGGLKPWPDAYAGPDPQRTWLRFGG